MTDQLRLRITEDLAAGQCCVEVLDKDDKVLGDLSGSVERGGVKWEMSGGLSEPTRALGRVTITLACERARIDTIEVPGSNAPKRTNPFLSE